MRGHVRLCAQAKQTEHARNRRPESNNYFLVACAVIVPVMTCESWISSCLNFCKLTALTSEYSYLA